MSGIGRVDPVANYSVKEIVSTCFQKLRKLAASVMNAILRIFKTIFPCLFKTDSNTRLNADRIDSLEREEKTSRSSSLSEEDRDHADWVHPEIRSPGLSSVASGEGTPILDAREPMFFVREGFRSFYDILSQEDKTISRETLEMVHKKSIGIAAESLLEGPFSFVDALNQAHFFQVGKIESDLFASGIAYKLHRKAANDKISFLPALIFQGEIKEPTKVYGVFVKFNQEDYKAQYYLIDPYRHTLTVDDVIKFEDSRDALYSYIALVHKDPEA